MAIEVSAAAVTLCQAVKAYEIADEGLTSDANSHKKAWQDAYTAVSGAANARAADQNIREKLEELRNARTKALTEADVLVRRGLRLR